MKERFIEMMIADYEQLIHIPKDSYSLVIPQLKLIHKQRGEFLKKAGVVDKVSRYICEGFIGYYRSTPSGLRLFAIYQPSDTVFDLDSYRSGKPSDAEIKAISPVIYLEFSFDDEQDLTAKDIFIMRLALAVNQRVTQRQARVLEISKMGFETGYPILMKEFKGLAGEISNPDLGSFFNISTRSVIRNKRKSK
ncbi:cyclic nucleotide-binding domain-containing protein [Algoriphagus taiwanensis]|uniref:Crp/Fnr family transcriptional regulator n=1 Tax=Algoriphagus taiwanensis TaxID=1445656 RepID=A0ABQ6Q770_9BACT|nr:hypothetical protein Ataiwa_37930 [Algoriphagus taiwanensis]